MEVYIELWHIYTLDNEYTKHFFCTHCVVAHEHKMFSLKLFTTNLTLIFKSS